MSVRYENTIVINRPVEVTAALFRDFHSLTKWQPGLTGVEHVPGTPTGQVGGQMDLLFARKSKTMVLRETIEVQNLPHSFAATYEFDGVWTAIANRFASVNDDAQTQWTALTEFQFTVWYMKLIGKLMPAAFKEQSLKVMHSFKEYVESQPLN